MGDNIVITVATQIYKREKKVPVSSTNPCLTELISRGRLSGNILSCALFGSRVGAMLTRVQYGLLLLWVYFALSAFAEVIQFSPLY